MKQSDSFPLWLHVSGELFVSSLFGFKLKIGHTAQEYRSYTFIGLARKSLYGDSQTSIFDGLDYLELMEKNEDR